MEAELGSTICALILAMKLGKMRDREDNRSLYRNFRDTQRAVGVGQGELPAKKPKGIANNKVNPNL